MSNINLNVNPFDLEEYNKKEPTPNVESEEEQKSLYPRLDNFQLTSSTNVLEESFTNNLNEFTQNFRQSKNSNNNLDNRNNNNLDSTKKHKQVIDIGNKYINTRQSIIHSDDNSLNDTRETDKQILDRQDLLNTAFLNNSNNSNYDSSKYQPTPLNTEDTEEPDTEELKQQARIQIKSLERDKSRRRRNQPGFITRAFNTLADGIDEQA